MIQDLTLIVLIGVILLQIVIFFLQGNIRKLQASLFEDLRKSYDILDKRQDYLDARIRTWEEPKAQHQVMLGLLQEHDHRINHLEGRPSGASTRQRRGN